MNDTVEQVGQPTYAGDEKPKEQFRKYKLKSKVAKFYAENHINQTVEFVRKTKAECMPSEKYKFDIFEVLALLDEIVDNSDPDNRRPQIFHALQTAEACREMFPERDWFHLIGFIHDLGKVLSHKKMQNLPQWAVVGDTFPVGCAYSDKVVYTDFFQENPDFKNDVYNTKYGIYQENCGFDNLEFSWGHDEYMYQVLKQNECLIPEEGLYVIRYHSFYAWHQSEAYSHLASEKDLELLPLVKDFQKCDLYSKRDEEVKIDELIPYYQGLIHKYFPSPMLNW
jgi:inositol oxygenase